MWIFENKIFMAVFGLCCCAWAFSICSEWGLISGDSVWASHCSGLSCCRAQALGMWASVLCGAQAYLLQDTWNISRPGIRPVIKPVSPALEADSQLLDHREVPCL